MHNKEPSSSKGGLDIGVNTADSIQANSGTIAPSPSQTDEILQEMKKNCDEVEAKENEQIAKELQNTESSGFGGGDGNMPYSEAGTDFERLIVIPLGNGREEVVRQELPQQPSKPPLMEERKGRFTPVEDTAIRKALTEDLNATRKKREQC